MALTKERVKEIAEKRLRKLHSQGYFQRGADITPEHEAVLRAYGTKNEIGSMGEMVASLLIDAQEIADDNLVAKADIDKAMARDRKSAKKIGIFLTEDQFFAIRKLPQALNPHARKSMANGLAILIESGKRLGILEDES